MSRNCLRGTDADDPIDYIIAELPEMPDRGLSQADAAAVAGVQDRVVRKWLRGEYRAPADKWRHIVDLDRRQDRAARETVAMIEQRIAEHGLPDTVTISISRTQEEAEARGWPCPGAHLAVVARVVERAPQGIEIAPVYTGEDAAADAAAATRAREEAG